VIDGIVHICAMRYPDIDCASSADDFAQVETVLDTGAGRVTMDGRWLIVGTEDIVDGVYDTVLTGYRYEGGQWVEKGSEQFAAHAFQLHVDADPLGNLHMSSSLIADTQNPMPAVRYFQFRPDGTTSANWVSCAEAQPNDVVGLSDGTPVVSFGTDPSTGSVYVASPG
jgi:hypothetical protein